jgi:hypothetical protein
MLVCEGTRGVSWSKTLIAWGAVHSLSPLAVGDMVTGGSLKPARSCGKSWSRVLTATVTFGRKKGRACRTSARSRQQRVEDQRPGRLQAERDDKGRHAREVVTGVSPETLPPGFPSVPSILSAWAGIGPLCRESADSDAPSPESLSEGWEVLAARLSCG